MNKDQHQEILELIMNLRSAQNWCCSGEEYQRNLYKRSADMIIELTGIALTRMDWDEYMQKASDNILGKIT